MHFDQNGLNQLFLNPRSSESEKQVLRDLKNCFEKDFGQQGYFLVPSSGSSKSIEESVKLIALKTESVLNSARRFNKFFNVQNPIWGLVLPEFHIAGIAVHARAFLSKSTVVQTEWNVENFKDWLITKNVTHLSLVPTQIFDIVKEEIECPPQVQVVLVGGAKLNTYDKSIMAGLGWPCYETYGMTETSSLIASRGPLEKDFTLLPAIQVQVGNGSQARNESLTGNGFQARNDSQAECGLLKIKCDSLLTAVIQKKENEVKIWTGLDAEGFLQTEDVVNVFGNQIEFLGRETNFVKINGEGVSLDQLRELLMKIDRFSTLLALPDKRSGHRVVLVTESDEAGGCNEIRKFGMAGKFVEATGKFDKEAGKFKAAGKFDEEAGKFNEKKLLEVQDLFNAQVKPYERITEVFVIKEIPKTDLGKIKLKELERMISEKYRNNKGTK